MASANAQLDTLEAEVESRIGTGSPEPPGSASPNHEDLEEDSLPVSPSGDLLPVASDDEDDAIW